MSEQDKCPKCGDLFAYSTPVGGFNNVGRYYVYTCGTRCLQGRVIEEGKDCLSRQLAQAKAENERLMKERDGWHSVVIDCERLFRTPDTAISPLASNLTNLIRDLRQRAEKADAACAEYRIFIQAETRCNNRGSTGQHDPSWCEKCIVLAKTDAGKVINDELKQLKAERDRVCEILLLGKNPSEDEYIHLITDAAIHQAKWLSCERELRNFREFAQALLPSVKPVTPGLYDRACGEMYHELSKRNAEELRRVKAALDTAREVQQATDTSLFNLSLYAQDEQHYALPMSGNAVTVRDVMRELRDQLAKANACGADFLSEVKLAFERGYREGEHSPDCKVDVSEAWQTFCCERGEVRGDEAQEILDELAKLRELKAKGCVCAFCGHGIALDDPDKAEKMAEHLQMCEKHPLRLALDRIEFLETSTAMKGKLLDEAQAERDRQLQVFASIWKALGLSDFCGKNIVDAVAEAVSSRDSAVAAELDGAGLIANERRRQMQEEGWTAEHDDDHAHGEMAQAAMCYASPKPLIADLGVPYAWPWDRKWWKPKDRVHNLVIAGALIAAEIDRLRRAAAIRQGGEAKP